MANQGQITPYKSPGGTSSLSDLMNMYKQISSLAGGGPDPSSGSSVPGFDATNPSASEMPTIESPQIGDSAMSRRTEANNNHPDSLIAQGLKHADDPNTPLDYDTRMSVIEPMLRAQHFGIGGGYEKGSQGEIKTTDTKQNSNGLGSLISLAALA